MISRSLRAVQGRSDRNLRAGIVELISSSSPNGRPMLTQPRIDIAETDLHELERSLEAAGRPRFPARQIFQWIPPRGVTDFAAMTDIGRQLREQLNGGFMVTTPQVV